MPVQFASGVARRTPEYGKQGDTPPRLPVRPRGRSVQCRLRVWEAFNRMQRSRIRSTSDHGLASARALSTGWRL
jgi:hypothetical protein